MTGLAGLLLACDGEWRTLVVGGCSSDHGTACIFSLFNACACAARKGVRPLPMRPLERRDLIGGRCTHLQRHVLLSQQCQQATSHSCWCRRWHAHQRGRCHIARAHRQRHVRPRSSLPHPPHGSVRRRCESPSTLRCLACTPPRRARCLWRRHSEVATAAAAAVARPTTAHTAIPTTQPPPPTPVVPAWCATVVRGCCT